MKQAVVTIKYDEEKLNAIRQYMGRKDADFEAELNDVLGRMYEKYGAVKSTSVSGAPGLLSEMIRTGISKGPISVLWRELK